MKVKQFVMAYSAEQDRIRAILPDGFESLRPVLRINAEIIDDIRCSIEFNTAVIKMERKAGSMSGIPAQLNSGRIMRIPSSNLQS